MLIDVKLNDGTELELMGSEIADLINSYERRILAKDRIIHDYERQIVNQVNHIFELGKEIDGLTEYAFDSPFMHRREKKV